MADSVEDDDKWLYSSSEPLQEDNDVIINKESQNLNEKESEELSQLFDNKPSDDFRQLFDVSQIPQEIDSNNKLNESMNDINEEEEERNEFDSHEKDLNQDLGDNNNDDEEEEDEEEDDDDDDVQVTIGDIKAGPTAFPYGSTPMNLNITKRGAAFGSGQGSAAIKTKAGLDIDAIGTINGLSIFDVNLDSLEEKPWRKPGADITDYFNYGFNEDVWKLYCERQKKLRSNEMITNGPPVTTKAAPFAGSAPLTPGKGGTTDQPIPIASVNENSKYTGIGLTKKAGPPPGRKQSGTIDVIGGGTPTTPSQLPSRRPPETKENFIQVIGNRPPGPPGPPPPGLPPGMPFPPMSMPPPFGFPPPGVEFPPGMHPPPMPLIAPNGQPLPYPPGDFPPMRFPLPGILPHPDHHFEEHNNNFHEGMRVSPNKFDDGREAEHERDRDRDRDYHRSSRGYSREYRDDESYRSNRSSHYRHERDYEHHERSRDREFDKESETRRHRDRDKDREREKSDSHRDRESSSRSRRHHEHDYDDEHSRGSSSSRHKHSKRSKREKEEETDAKH